ncbi:MAG: hypothetical protein AAFY82_06575 [Pseudomonadota bacterium]
MSLPKDPTEFNRPSQKLLSETDIDGVGRAVMTLCHELWVVKDRMAVLEAVLADNGIDAERAIDAFQPDAALQDKLNQDGRALVERILSALNGTG